MYSCNKKSKYMYDANVDNSVLKKTQMYLPHIRINTRTTKSNNNTGFCIYPFKNKEINTGHLKCAK